MAEEPEVIRQQIEETRSSLADKIETLETEVRGTVREATTAVSETVENVKESVENTIANVKDSVQETVDNVKHTLNLRRHFEEYPWVFVGAGAAAGFLLGSMVRPGSRSSRHMIEGMSDYSETYGSQPPPPRSSSFAAPAYAEPRPAGRSEPGFLSGLMSQFSPELDKLKGLAIGLAVAAARDLVRDMIPRNIEPQVSDVISNITTKLGGENIEGPVLSSASEPGRPGSSGTHRSGNRF